jgi:hypothetical protein
MPSIVLKILYIVSVYAAGRSFDRHIKVFNSSSYILIRLFYYKANKSLWLNRQSL